MIISEFAGAAQSLNGSIVVNPWDSQEVADAIFQSVTMDADTRAENQRKLFKVRLPSDFALHATHGHYPLCFVRQQYVNKYSAAYWGTSFVREMTRIELPEAKPVAESPADSTPDTPVQKNGALPNQNHTVEELKGGQAELHLTKEDMRGSIVENGTVQLTPAQNALAPHNSA